jgi:hypothetical protein
LNFLEQFGVIFLEHGDVLGELSLNSAADPCDCLVALDVFDILLAVCDITFQTN